MEQKNMNRCFWTANKRLRCNLTRNLVLLLALFTYWNVNAAEAEAEADAEAEAALQALFGALEQETQIATRTKMNIDFVPGMVSVLYGKDLLERGVRNAGEALALIPGVELSVASDGQSQVFVRGIGTAFSSGKIKVLFNGVPFNSTLSVATTSLHVPVEQIDRIEVIRGPGSTIYGEFAYSGVVNVVTRKEVNQVFARHGSHGNNEAGIQLWHENKVQDWQVNLNFAGTNIDGEEVQSGPDVLRNTPFSRAPGPANEKERDRSAVFRFDYSDFNFLVQWAKVDAGDAFGIANALPDPEPKIMRKVGMLSVQAEQHWKPSSDFDIKANVGWLDYRLKSGLHEFYPPGFAGVNMAPVPIAGVLPGQPFYPDGLIGSPNYEERKYRVSTEFSYIGLEDHEWLFGFEWLYTDSGDTYAVRNYNPNVFIPTTSVPAPAPLAVYRGDDNWLEEGLTRRVFGLFVQDQYNVSEKLTVTAGLRFDSYDDVGHATSPRLAAVYRVSEQNTVKVQYARAFRPPTFLETSTKNNPVVIGDPNIESELIDNYELGYIFNDGTNMLRATLFMAELTNLIVLDSTTNHYANEGGVNLVGSEVEYSRKFGNKLRLDATLSYVEAKEASSNEHVADVAHIIGNVGMVYRPWTDYVVSTQYRYVSERERAKNDPRDKLDGYELVDITAGVENVMVEGLSLRAGVKNMFDVDVRYPAPLVSFGGSVIPSYPEDYPRPGREYWVEMGFEF